MNDSDRADLKQAIGESNRIRVEFLLADAESAHAFLDVAERSTDPDAFERNVSRARQLLAAINDFLSEARGDEPMHEKVPEARDRLQARLDQLKRP